MIRFDFDYYKTHKLMEAYSLMSALTKDNQKAVYYSGGTELLTSFRKGTINSNAVIDLKSIDGITCIECSGNEVTIGACVCLNDVIKELDCHYINDVLIKIADHTVRNAITIGGNICGRLPYKEAILPLLAVNAIAVIYTCDGLKEVYLSEIFDKRLKMNKGDILYQFKFNTDCLHSYFTKRVTESTATDYPILHLFASIHKEKLFIGLSGFSSFPIYHNFELNDVSVQKIYDYFLPSSKGDSRSSKSYRNNILLTILKNMNTELEGFDD